MTGDSKILMGKLIKRSSRLKSKKKRIKMKNTIGVIKIRIFLELIEYANCLLVFIYTMRVIPVIKNNIEVLPKCVNVHAIRVITA